MTKIRRCVLVKFHKKDKFVFYFPNAVIQS